jgi:hypothetical protein
MRGVCRRPPLHEGLGFLPSMLNRKYSVESVMHAAAPGGAPPRRISDYSKGRNMNVSNAKSGEAFLSLGDRTS